MSTAESVKGLAKKMRQQGFDPQAIEAALQKENRSLSNRGITPLSDAEVRFIVRGNGDNTQLEENGGASTINLEGQRKQQGGKSKSEVARQGHSLKLFEPEPWPEPVDGDVLLNEITSLFKRFIVLVECAAETLALWVLHSHAFEAASTTPRLVISSPEKRCGKTSVLALLAHLVRKPLPTSNISSAALYRTVEAVCPTLLVDEADTFLHEKNELRGIINSGHIRSMAQIVRTVGENFEPRAFTTWAPLAIALIGQLHNTLEDRSILIPMHRKRKNEPVEKMRYGRLEQVCSHLASKAARWAKDHVAKLRSHEPTIPETLNDRAANNWEPLLAIAESAGDEWAKRAREAARTLSGDSTGDDSSLTVELLADIRDIFSSTGEDKLMSAALCEQLSEMKDRPWHEWGKKAKPISAHQLARLLRPFGIRPVSIRIGNETPKGYHLDHFHDAFSRYPSPQTATPQQDAEMTDADGLLEQENLFSNRNTRGAVANCPTDTNTIDGPQKDDCGGVADRSRESGMEVDEVGSPLAIPRVGTKGPHKLGKCVVCGEYTHLNYVSRSSQRSHYCQPHARAAGGLPPINEASSG